MIYHKIKLWKKVCFSEEIVYFRAAAFTISQDKKIINTCCFLYRVSLFAVVITFRYGAITFCYGDIKQCRGCGYIDI